MENQPVAPIDRVWIQAFEAWRKRVQEKIFTDEYACVKKFLTRELRHTGITCDADRLRNALNHKKRYDLECLLAIAAAKGERIPMPKACVKWLEDTNTTTPAGTQSSEQPTAALTVPEYDVVDLCDESSFRRFDQTFAKYMDEYRNLHYFYADVPPYFLANKEIAAFVEWQLKSPEQAIPRATPQELKRLDRLIELYRIRRDRLADPTQPKIQVRTLLPKSAWTRLTRAYADIDVEACKRRLMKRSGGGLDHVHIVDDDDEELATRAPELVRFAKSGDSYCFFLDRDNNVKLALQRLSDHRMIWLRSEEQAKRQYRFVFELWNITPAEKF